MRNVHCAFLQRLIMGIIVSIVLFIIVGICIVVFAFIVPEQKRLAKEKAKRAKLKALEDAKYRASNDFFWAKNIADCEAYAQKKAKQEEWAQTNPVEARLEAERLAAARAQINPTSPLDSENLFGPTREYKRKKRAEAKARDELADAIAKALRKGR